MVPQQEVAAAGSCQHLDESVTSAGLSQAATPRHNKLQLQLNKTEVCRED